MLSNQMASPSLFPLPASSLHPGCADRTLCFCRFNTMEKDRPILVYVLCIANPQFFLSSRLTPTPSLNFSLFFTVTVPLFCHFPSLCIYFFLLTLAVSLFPICSHLYLCGRRRCLARSNSKTLGLKTVPLINPFRSYIGPRPTVWFSSSAPMSEDVRHFLLRLFVRCRNLSDVFPHVVRTLANR
jgi:hypothetical protein